MATPPTDPRALHLVSLREFLIGRVLPGSKGAQYRLRERIGEGAQGWIFTASWDDPGAHPVVVKVLRPEVGTPEALARFAREAQVLQMLAQERDPNPNIVRFLDHASTLLPFTGGAETVELHYTVLEYVRGPTLEQVLGQSRGAGLPLERVRRIGRQVARALEEVHAHKIVHRDLKPSNVLLSLEGGHEIAKVTDFGLVKIIDLGVGKTVSLAGASLGYAPPEQFEQGNRRVSARTDVFSFAAILYEMLTGVKAFPYGESENPLLVVTRILNGPRPSLSVPRAVLAPELTSRPELVERLSTVFARATAAEPLDRFATIGELWAAVDASLRVAAEVRGASSGPYDGPASSSSGLVETLETIARDPSDLDPKLTNPAAWTWRVRVPPLRPGAARAAVFEPGGETAFAIGAAGLMRLAGPAWSKLPEPPDLDPRLVRGAACPRAGELVVFGARGLVARLVPGGPLEHWDMPDREVTFLGGHADPQGTMTLVGERPSRRDVKASGQGATIGTIAQFARGKVTLLCDAAFCARLRGVTRLRSGVVVACGDWGTIARLELGVPELVGSVCGGHLSAIAALHDGGAVTVGAGGHALSLTAKLQAQLEAVQTTRDLSALVVDPAQVAWAGSAQARVLRRTSGSWVRMSGELGLTSAVVALWVTPRAVRAICDDGAVVEGAVS